MRIYRTTLFEGRDGIQWRRYSPTTKGYLAARRTYATWRRNGKDHKVLLEYADIPEDAWTFSAVSFSEEEA